MVVVQLGRIQPDPVDPEMEPQIQIGYARQVELVALVNDLPRTILPAGTVDEIELAAAQAGVVQESTVPVPSNPPTTKPEPDPPASTTVVTPLRSAPRMCVFSS